VRRYAYAVVPANADVPAVHGLDGQPVHLSTHGDAGVIWSWLDADRVRPRRKHLAAHDGVLTSAMALAPVIPLTFGTSVDEHDEVARAILGNCDRPALHERFAALDGKVQVELSYEPDETEALRRVLQRSPELGDPSVPAVNRGERIATAVDALAVEDLSRIAQALAAETSALGEVEQRPRAARIAALVNAGSADAFLDEVEAMVKTVAPAGRLRAMGGLPPYAFSESTITDGVG
jgi:hypothetical protein